MHPCKTVGEVGTPSKVFGRVRKPSPNILGSEIIGCLTRGNDLFKSFNEGVKYRGASIIRIISCLYSKSPYIETSKLQTFKDVNMLLHVQSCSLQSLCTLSAVWIVCKWLGLCVLYSTVQRTVVWYLYFKSRMSESKHKNSGDVAGAAKKGQAIMMETKVRIIAR